MTRFQLDDVVALKSDGQFVGIVQRLSSQDADVPDDTLIIAYTDVPQELLSQFVLTGVAPIGYVFVQFSRQEQGSALIAEADLHLLDRSLEIGECVKQEDSTLTGTVVNISNTYVLDPIWQPQLTGDFRAKPSDECAPPDHTCTSACNPLDPRVSHPRPYRLIHNVPDEEVRRSADFLQDDYILFQEWLGVLDENEPVVIIKLDNNSIVAVDGADELFIPVPEYERPFIFVPESDEIHKPHIVSAMAGWSQVIPAEHLEAGQLVVFNQRTIKNGRWLRGSYQPNLKNHGRVLMLRANHLSVRWLTCNPLTPSHHWEAKHPDHCIPYENLSTFPTPQEIRRDKRIVLWESSRPTTTIEDRTRVSLKMGGPERSKNVFPVNITTSLSVGNQVKFRDPAGAAVKYQGQEYEDVIHHRFERIHHSETLGYELNEFRIIQSKRRVTVLWQDGTYSDCDSVSLTRANLFETVMAPASLVVAREGMKQKVAYDATLGEKQPTHPLVDFNEMTFFERPHDLFPAKVGVIQDVDPNERIAHVRWFEDAKIRITTSGNALGSESRFGLISNDVEAVSLYEVMSFSGITREVGDLVTFAPLNPSSKALKILSQITDDDLREVNASITLRSQIPDRDNVAVLEWMQHNARLNMDDTPVRQTPAEHYKPHRSVDWVGFIVKLGLDGAVYVRVNTGDWNGDIILDHDQILSVVDPEAWSIDLNADVMQMDGMSDSEGSNSYWSDDEVLVETVEYEGGKRIDDEPDDENWVSDSNVDEDDVSETNSQRMHKFFEKLPPEVLHQDFLPPELQLENLLAQNPSRDPRDVLIEKIWSLVDEQESNPSREQPTSSRLPTMLYPPPQPIPNPSPSSHDRSLRHFLPTQAPPPFLSLECEPPADQFRVDVTAPVSASFSKRILKEHRILNSSLPDGEIYVRTYDSRLDLLRCMIIGPRDTPYEHAPFLIDLHLGPEFPHKPPTAHFHSWTSGLGRINPNLYEDGKICLSLLGTWPGKAESEGWSDKATLLQLLVSLQGLVFVKAPFFNEAGYEGEEAQGQYKRESYVYTEKAFVMARNFVKFALTRPVPGFEDVLAWLYLPHNSHNGNNTSARNVSLLQQVVERGESLIKVSERQSDSEGEILVAGDGSSHDPTTVFLCPLSKGALVMLRKTIDGLREIGRTV